MKSGAAGHKIYRLEDLNLKGMKALWGRKVSDANLLFR